MPTLGVDGGRIHYDRQGEGPPIVFVNDWVLSGSYWREGISHLRREFCCVTYDPRGVGRSQSFRSTASYSIERHAEDLHRLIVSLRSGYAHLVGHGLGALIVGLCLKSHPQDVHTISLVATEPELGTEQRLQDRFKHIQSLIILRRVATWPLVRSLALRRYSLGRLSLAARKGLLRDFARMNPRAAWETVETALEEHTYREFVAGVTGSTVPLLLVACGQDKLSSMEGARNLFSQIDRGRLVTLRQAGHFPMLESPEKFVEILKDFWSVAVSG